MTISPETAAEFAECEALLRKAGQGRDEAALVARQTICQTLARIPTGVEDARKARIALEVAKQVYYFTSDLFSAVLPSAQAVSFARFSGQRDLLRQALMMQAVVMTDMENLADAFAALDEGLEVAESAADDHKGQAAVWINLGNACYTGFFYGDALTAFRRGEQCCKRAGLHAGRTVPLQNIALCCLELNRHDEGLAAIREAINMAGEPRSPQEHFNRVFAEGTFVRLLLASDRNRCVEARERLVFAKRSAELSGSMRAEIAAAGTEGLVQVYAGSADVGREVVLAHLERARTAPSTLRAALLTTVQTLEAAGDSGEALSYHREFCLHVKRQLRNQVLLYTKRQLIALQDADGALGDQARKEQAATLRARYVQEASLPGHSAESFLLSQAMMGEAEWDDSGSHVFRVGELVRRLAEAYGMDEVTCNAFMLAARLHDIGMKAVPRSLKLKTDRLTPEERSVMMMHSVDGADLISHCALPYRDLAEDVVRHHHERHDGRGYPDGLRGNAIPLVARMTALADVFDVLRHDRRYARAISVDEALAFIASESGGQFDPQLVPLFVDLVKTLCAEHGDAQLDPILSVSARDTAMTRTRARLRQ